MAKSILFGLFVLMAMGASFGQRCAYYDTVLGPFPYVGRIGMEEHITGDHFWAASFGAQCFYTGPEVGDMGPCTGDARAQSMAGTTESGGSLVNPLYKHVGNWEIRNGAATSTGGLSAEADTQSAAAFRSCLGGFCSVSIGISGSGSGAGFSVTLPPDKIYGDSHYYKVTCAGRTGVPRQTGGNGGKGCPLVVNVKNRGYRFTDPNKGCVRFDLRNDGKPACYSWPRPDSGLAFLVLDLNGDGQIKSGAELFGNFSPQPAHPNPNGFLALMQYDLNHDLVIDNQDAVWPRLKLWIDQHCYRNPEQPCSALPEELHSLESEGIHSLGVVYSMSDKTDRWGNEFRFYAQTNPRVHKLQQPEDEMRERRMYDVFLVSRP